MFGRIGEWFLEKGVNLILGKVAGTIVKMWNDWLGSKRAKEAGRAEERASHLEANAERAKVADQVSAETEALSDEALDKELMGDDK
jgi:hypothetical protein